MAKPWGEEKPTLSEFVEHYKATMSKDEIVERVNVTFELGLDVDMTKAELLTAVFERDDIYWSNMEEPDDPDAEPGSEPAEDAAVDTADAKPLDGEDTGLLPDPPAESEPESTPEDKPADHEALDAVTNPARLDAVTEPTSRYEHEPLEYEAPGLEEIMDLGFDADAAERIAAAFKNAESVFRVETFRRDTGVHRANKPHYLVSGATKRGYWKIGRQFTKEQTIFAEELTAEEMKELDNANPKHLSVKRIGFDGEEV